MQGNTSAQRSKILESKSTIDKLIKENYRKEKMTFLVNKYFNKITETDLKENHKNKNTTIY